MWLLFVPLVILLAIVGGVIALVAILAAVAEAMPLLAVGLVIWALVMMGRSPRHRHRAQHPRHPRRAPPAAAPRPGPATMARSSAPPPRAQPRPRPELPIDVQVKVEQIRRKADVLLSYAHRFPPFSQDLYIVKQTTSEYLPRTIEAYLSLPPGAGERMVTASGKTALQELREQLQLMDAKLDDVAQDLQRRDLAGLLANRRFLELRFAPREDEAHVEARQRQADALQASRLN